MVVPKLTDLKGVDFSKKYLNPFNSTFYYNDFEIHNVLKGVYIYKDYNSWGVWFNQKIIFHGHEYVFGDTTQLLYLHDINRIDFVDKYRSQIPYKNVFGFSITGSSFYGLYIKEVITIERLVECLKLVLKPYNLNMAHDKWVQLCGDICDKDFPNINHHRDIEDLTTSECLEIFKNNNIAITNVEYILDDLNKIRYFNYDEFPINVFDLHISDDELFPEYHHYLELRLPCETEDNARISPELLLKEYEFDEELETFARYVDFLLKENKLGLDYWIDIGLNSEHIYDAKGTGILEYETKVVDLKKVLKEYGLKQSGKKAELIERIKDNLSPAEINREFEGSFYLLTNKGKEFINKNIHFTYMQPTTFTFKEYIIICEENPEYDPEEILCCLAREDWITMDGFNWKDYLDCDFSELDSNTIFEIEEYFSGKINEFNYDDTERMIFNNPNLLNRCPEIRKQKPVLDSNFWDVSEIDEGGYKWAYSYSQYGDSGVIKTISLEDLKKQVTAKKLPWDKSEILYNLRRK